MSGKRWSWGVCTVQSCQWKFFFVSTCNTRPVLLNKFPKALQYAHIFLEFHTVLQKDTNQLTNSTNSHLCQKISSCKIGRLRDIYSKVCRFLEINAIRSDTVTLTDEQIYEKEYLLQGNLIKIPGKNSSKTTQNLNYSFDDSVCRRFQSTSNGCLVE